MIVRENKEWHKDNILAFKKDLTLFDCQYINPHFKASAQFQVLNQMINGEGCNGKVILLNFRNQKDFLVDQLQIINPSLTAEDIAFLNQVFYSKEEKEVPFWTSTNLDLGITLYLLSRYLVAGQHSILERWAIKNSKLFPEGLLSFKLVNMALQRYRAESRTNCLCYFGLYIAVKSLTPIVQSMVKKGESVESLIDFFKGFMKLKMRLPTSPVN